MKSAIILDRDGTIIEDKVYLNDVSKIEYLPLALEGLRAFRDLDFMLVVATNQSGVARGIVSIENLYRIHEKIRSDLSREGIDIQGFYYAPYSVESNHYMRKPNPGMLKLAAKDFNLNLSRSFMIGDRETDVLAGQAAGTKTIYLNHTFPLPAGIHPDFQCANLLEAARWVSSIRTATIRG